MVAPITTNLGSRGTLVIPASVRYKYGIEQGSLLIVEERPEGILLRPAKAVPVEPEAYTPERKAEFLLNNAVGEEDYRRAVEEVRNLGLDPENIPHVRRGGGS